MANIFWDTNLFIYLFEEHPKHGPAVLELWERMTQRDDRLITSAFTLGELLVQPTRAGDAALAETYRNLFLQGAIHIVNFDAGCAAHYARLRTDKTIRPPDAIQLACACAARADLFVTNDHRLARKSIPGLPFISALETVPL